MLIEGGKLAVLVKIFLPLVVRNSHVVLKLDAFICVHLPFGLQEGSLVQQLAPFFEIDSNAVWSAQKVANLHLMIKVKCPI